ncbi:MAG: L,D-transpeptidase family protein [Clostridiales bacterium]|nr:L,D-transpeptidase family protein [Clostridiales bacterium]
MKHKQRHNTILIATAGTLILVYLGFTLFFTNHFYFRTVINNIKCSGKTVKQVESLIAEEVSQYHLKLIERGGDTEILTGSDFDYSYVKDEQLAKKLKEQNPFLWPLSIFSKDENEWNVSVTYEEDKLAETLSGLSCMDSSKMQKPEDAAVIYDDDSQCYTIKEETEGTTLKTSAFKKAVKEALERTSETLDLEESGCYQNPAYYSNDKTLSDLKDQLNQYLNVTITYDFSDRTETVDASVIKDFLVITKDLKASIDKTKVREYIDQLSRSTNTFGKTRSFHTSNDADILVSGGDYGWLISRDKETNALIADIKAGENVKREPNYLQTAYCRDSNDIGDTYAEVDLTNQHMWYYQDGKMVLDSDVVTGSERYNTPTNTGTYAITYKERDATLSGQNYATPVSYWMPFNGNIGFHDAPWRNGKFGGDIYLTNGSHGCVNMPPEKAKMLYSLIEKGVPVVVYKGELLKTPAS